MQELSDLIQDIKTESNGYRFGELWKFWPFWVLAIIHPVPTPKEYYVLPEVRDKIRFRDSGSINQAYATGITKPVLVLSGSSFGSYRTQSRGVEHNVLILPYEQKKVAVKCINAPHPIAAGEDLYYDSIVSKNLRFTTRRSNQNDVWNTIDDNIYRQYDSVYEDLTIDSDHRHDYVYHTIKRRISSSRFSEFINKFPVFQDQIGIIPIHDKKGVQGIEVFSHPDAFKYQYKDIIESYVESIDEYEDNFTQTPDKILKQIYTFLDQIAIAKELHLHDSIHTCEVRAGKYSGELTRYKGDIIYCFLNEGERNVG